MSKEVITGLYCPDCSGETEINPSTMLADNGWIIEYDIDLARFMAVSRLTVEPEEVRPEFLFDNGYACWLEMYPGEKQDILEERAEIMKLQQVDQNRYLQEISTWNIARIERLKADGWRKAMAA